jgi:hypothetical protein
MTAIFTPKPFAEIVAAEIERVRLSTDRLTDFNVGSVTRSLLEANAVELDNYYQEMYLGLMRAIPTAIYIGFGFSLREGIAATGTAVFARLVETEMTIPRGTRLLTESGAYFTTDAEVVIPENTASATVSITAEVIGAAGNAEPHALAVINDSILYTVDNPAILAGGQDNETEEQRAERFAAFIRSLARGTPASLEYAATIPAIYHPITGAVAERAQRVAVYETPGYVELYIHNGNNGASAELLEAVQDFVDGTPDYAQNAWIGGYRPAGMQVLVKAMTNQAVNVALEIKLDVGYSQIDVATTVEERLQHGIGAAMPGHQLRPIDIINLALGVEGVMAVTVLAPVATLTVPLNTVLYLGTLTLTWTT